MTENVTKGFWGRLHCGACFKELDGFVDVTRLSAPIRVLCPICHKYINGVHKEA